jgi:hypothetical protein
MKISASRLLGCAAFAIAAGATLLPAPAQAWWRGGVFIGVPPVVVGPPVVAYPPPYYPYPYAYPPAAYAPAYPPPAYPPPPDQAQQSQPPQMSQAQPPYGTTCYAGVYVCPAPGATRVGSGCSCPGLGAPSYGTVQ